MLTKDNFTKEHIEKLLAKSKANPAVVEKTIYAFGLLEALKRSGMPFIFKGGTSLLLLLERPMRLSTDIDIIVPPGTDVDFYIYEAKKIFPFLGSEEDIRIGKNNIEKRHYKFLYESPLTEKSFHILLDILFEENPYNNLVEKPIRNDLLLTEGEELLVSVPSVDCILGDKLTAFAPHTTGVPFGVGKELEIIKQMLDCSTLVFSMQNLCDTKDTYQKVVVKEIGYRDIQVTSKDVLSDTIRSCITLLGRGSINSGDYTLYASGIDRIQGHLFSETLSGESAGVKACSILYLAALILKEEKNCKKIDDAEEYLERNIPVKKSRRISYVRQVDALAYAYLIEAYELLGEEFFVLE